jgi:iron complex outermembrane recepter protein
MELSENSDFTVQGDVYKLAEENIFTNFSPAPPFMAVYQPRTDASGGNALGKWNHNFSDKSNIQVQSYFDNTRRLVEGLWEEVRDTVDMEMQHSFSLGERNALIWGGNFRTSHGRTVGTDPLYFLPAQHTELLYGGFLQDEITVVPDRFKLILGAKAERNRYTGTEFLPSGRFAYTPNDSHTFWGSASRGIRVPSRTDVDLYLPLSIFNPLSTPPTVVGITGTAEFKHPESIHSFELGYRAQPTERTYVDVTGFYSLYNHISALGTTFGTPVVTPRHVVVPFNETESDAKLWGAEINGKWEVSQRWSLSAGFARQKANLEEITPSSDSNMPPPNNVANFRSYLDVTEDIEWNLAAYYYDNLSRVSPVIPAYTRVDTGLTWRPVRSLEISVWGQNLLEPRHPEFGTPFFLTSTQVQRAWYAKAAWKFGAQ